ncbi:ABC transporter ATP-binding protein/permease [Candidatus Pelagibacter sp.]|nr:ABC transporter ATP-binding protein/permease [Candidatus Pelagibacter sp.]
MNSSQLIKTIFDKNEKKIFFLTIFIGLIVACLEVMGLASIFPFVIALTSPDELNKFEFVIKFREYFNLSKNLVFINFLGFFYLSVILLSNLLGLVHAWLTNYLINKINFDKSKKLLKNYLDKEFEYHLKNNSSLLVTKIIEETLRFAHGVVGSFINLITKILLILFILISLLIINFKISLSVILIFSGLYFFIFVLIRKKISINGKKISHIMPKRQKKMFESLNGFKELTIYGKKFVLLDEFNNLSNHLKKLRWINSSLAQTPKFIIETIVLGGFIVFVLINQNQNENFLNLIPTISIFAFAAYKIMPASQQIFASYAQIKGDISSLKSLKNDLNEAKKIQNKFFKKIIFKDKIIIDKITFKYEEKEIFKDFKMIIKKNEIIGLKGDSGVGKSTLANIILGLIYPEKGKILIDKKILNQKNAGSWRKQIGYVGQNIYMFDESIKYNITLEKNKQKIDQTRLKKVLKDTNLNSLINSLPNKINTKVGERGSRLSGGQLQRISIARALYRKTELIIFDEPTSALDEDNEIKILNIIKNISKSKNSTIMIISHKKQMFRYCNKIYSIK